MSSVRVYRISASAPFHLQTWAKTCSSRFPPSPALVIRWLPPTKQKCALSAGVVLPELLSVLCFLLLPLLLMQRGHQLRYGQCDTACLAVSAVVGAPGSLAGFTALLSSALMHALDFAALFFVSALTGLILDRNLHLCQLSKKGRFRVVAKVFFLKKKLTWGRPENFVCFAYDLRRGRRGSDQCKRVCDLKKSVRIAGKRRNRCFQPWPTPIQKAVRTCRARKRMRPGSWVMLPRGPLSRHEMPSLTVAGLRQLGGGLW